MVHVGSASVASVTAWLNQHGVSFPVIMDPSNAIMYAYTGGPGGIPHTYIIGRDSVIRQDIPGATSETDLEGKLWDVIYLREAVNVDVVMDVSDSMNSPPSGGPTDDSKLALMKQAARMITDFLNDHGQADDQVGLTWFADDASQYTDPTGSKLVKVRTNVANLKAQIDGHSTGTCTAMGAGLQLTFDTLASVPKHRFAILCTDGMQNIEPKVTRVANHYEIVDSGGWLCGSHSSVAPHPGVSISQYKATVHSIGIGVEASYASVLQDVADSTGGFYRGTDDPQTDLDLIYFLDLCNCLASGSPAVICHETGRLCAETGFQYHSFNVSRSVRKMTLMLSWKPSLGGRLTFWVYDPAGNLVDIHTALKESDSYTLATLYLPVCRQGAPPTHVGQWRLAVAGRMPEEYADYHVLVIGEDNELKWRVDYPRRLYVAGDILPVEIYLQKERLPITSVNELVVETARLSAPLPELMAQYRSSAFGVGQVTQRLAERPRDRVLLKLQAMAADPEFRQRLKPFRSQTSLSSGALKVTIGPEGIVVPVRLTQTGLHSVKVKFQTETPEDGPIQRVDLISVLVGSGSADPKHTTIVLMELQGKGKKGVSARVTPRNAHGQLIGPGHPGDFRVRIGTSEVKAEVEDLLDGCYEVKLLLPTGEWNRLTKKGGLPQYSFQSRDL